MDFEVAKPLRIQLQPRADECTSCALAACAEDILGSAVDPDYIYENSNHDAFGVTAGSALHAIFSKGVRLIGSGEIHYPFDKFSVPLPWVFRFESMIRMLKRNDKSFFCGIYWQDDWTNSSDGIMRMPQNWSTWFSHSFKIFGVKQINGIIYLKVQNSLGDQKGDHGIWYMPADIAQKLIFAYQLK